MRIVKKQTSMHHSENIAFNYVLLKHLSVTHPDLFKEFRDQQVSLSFN